MNRFKYLSAVLFVALMAAVVVISCKDDNKEPDPAVEARAAGKEAGEKMCACVSNYQAPDPNTWTGTPQELQQAFQAYYGQLYACLGEITPYEQYARLRNPQNEPAQTDDPLLSVFIFHDENFKAGFVEDGVKSCYDTFNALWALIP